jgi:DNA-binding NarL/FixJ family response regulator
LSIRITIFDDSTERRESLEALLMVQPDIEWVGSYPNCANVLHDVEESQPDVILMDIDMPLVNGIEGVRLIRQAFPAIKVLMQTVFDEDDKVFESIKNGAAGYLLKKESAARIIEAIKEVHDGGAMMSPGIAMKVLRFFKEEQSVPIEDYKLSDREKDILRQLANGNSYKMIASALGLSYHTVNSHLKKIYEKLHVHSLGEAVALALKKKIV